MLANVVLGVLDSGMNLCGVLKYESSKNNRVSQWFKDCFCPSPEQTLLNKFKIKQFHVKSANSKKFRDILVKLKIDILIVSTWHEKIEKRTFDIPKFASVNVHPSMLPRYRGPNPYLQTILNGENSSGLTIHLLDENFDTGPILKQKQIEIFPNDTSKELRQRTQREARNLISELLYELQYKIVTPVKQNEKYASYYHNITGNERMLDFELQNSEQISRTVRALHPFLPCYITHKNDFFIVNPYHLNILDTDYKDYSPGTIIDKNPKESSVTIVCADNKAIKFDNLKLYSKKNTVNYIKKEVSIFD